MRDLADSAQILKTDFTYFQTSKKIPNSLSGNRDVQTGSTPKAA